MAATLNRTRIGLLAAALATALAGLPARGQEVAAPSPATVAASEGQGSGLLDRTRRLEDSLKTAEERLAALRAQVGQLQGSTNLFVPVGGIVDWWCWNNAPIPSGYEICDGSRVQDQGSPYAGQAKPNLVNKFTMGVAVAQQGTTGGRSDVPNGGAQNLNLPLVKTEARSLGGFEGKGSNMMGFARGSIPNHNHGGENRPPFVGVVKLTRVR